MLHYRLRTKIVGVLGATRPELISIPAGAILRVLDRSANSMGFLEVEWDGNNLQVFSNDFRDHGEFVTHAAHDSD